MNGSSVIPASGGDEISTTRSTSWLAVSASDVATIPPIEWPTTVAPWIPSLLSASATAPPCASIS